MNPLPLLVGSVKRHGVEPVDAVPELEAPLLEFGARTSMIPRDTVHHYIGWNPTGSRERMYTRVTGWSECSSSVAMTPQATHRTELVGPASPARNIVSRHSHPQRFLHLHRKRIEKPRPKTANRTCPFTESLFVRTEGCHGDRRATRKRYANPVLAPTARVNVAPPGSGPAGVSAALTRRGRHPRVATVRPVKTLTARSSSGSRFRMARAPMAAPSSPMAAVARTPSPVLATSHTRTRLGAHASPHDGRTSPTQWCRSGTSSPSTWDRRFLCRAWQAATAAVRFVPSGKLAGEAGWRPHDGECRTYHS
ncbi:DUF1864 family protein (plasmid) [Streptomyces sp. NBC_01717]